MSENQQQQTGTGQSFFDRLNVRKETIPVADGIPFGIESVTNKQVGIGGAYCSWGASYDNVSLKEFISGRLNEALTDDESMELDQLGFVSRHHIPLLSDEQHLELEVEVGARLLREAAKANGWEPNEVDAVLIGMSGPVADDYVEQIANRAGIRPEALKFSVHKACDGSVGGLNLALNPTLKTGSDVNVAEELHGKKVLVGGIEGLSRFTSRTRDKNALQLFGNGAGVIGVIPGQSMQFLVGKSHEAYDEDGVLAVRMYYPHSRQRIPGQSALEVSQAGTSHLRIAGLMHEPEDENSSIIMAGPMGMVKLFVRTGVQVVSDVYKAYQNLMEKIGTPDKSIAVAIVHHANYKINKLKGKHLLKEGISFPMPWLVNDFGNVSAASNMIVFLRQLPSLKPGDHILFDGFGAGTYYDVLAVALPG
jgi:3-oxoacyl-[acyl-carrier-protein] synthase III